MKLKYKIALAIVATAFALMPLLFVGCGTVFKKPTVDSSKYTPEYIEKKAYRVTVIVSARVLSKAKDPAATREKMEQALVDIEGLQEQPAISANDLLDIARRVPAVSSSDAAFYVDAGALFFEDDLEAIAINNPVGMQYALQGMSRGLKEVLAR